MKTFRMFTEDYVDSYALHRTTTGPGLDGYVPTADLNASKIVVPGVMSPEPPCQ